MSWRKGCCGKRDKTISFIRLCWQIKKSRNVESVFACWQRKKSEEAEAISTIDPSAEDWSYENDYCPNCTWLSQLTMEASDLYLDPAPPDLEVDLPD